MGSDSLRDATRLLIVAVSMVVAVGTVAAQQPLTIYVIDTEGGKAALWIAPSGQTVLIDSGSPGTRDLDRLMEAISAAGVTRIDYLISTHYHVDHVGGLQELVRRIPVGTFVDHGPTVEGPVAPNLREQVPGFQAAYAELWTRAKHVVVKPGDTIPVAGLDWRIVASAGATLKAPIAGAPGAGQPNRAACAQTQSKDITSDPENGQSVRPCTRRGSGAGRVLLCRASGSHGRTESGGRQHPALSHDARSCRSPDASAITIACGLGSLYFARRSA